MLTTTTDTVNRSINCSSSGHYTVSSPNLVVCFCKNHAQELSAIDPIAFMRLYIHGWKGLCIYYTENLGHFAKTLCNICSCAGNIDVTNTVDLPIYFICALHLWIAVIQNQ